jgi:hypothetical protein
VQHIPKHFQRFPARENDWTRHSACSGKLWLTHHFSHAGGGDRRTIGRPSFSLLLQVRFPPLKLLFDSGPDKDAPLPLALHDGVDPLPGALRQPDHRHF